MPKSKKVHYGEEHLYEIIPRADPPKRERLKYTSIHHDKVVKDVKAVKKDQATFGPVTTPLSAPNEFLKKTNHESLIPAKAERKEGQRINQERKQKLPKEQGKIVLSNNQDFIKKNAIETITSIPKKPLNITCDTRHGKKQLLDESGLVVKYSLKKDYGKLPDYVQQKNLHMQQEKEAYENYKAEILRSKALEQISDADKEATLKSLKDKWNDLHEEFQGLSVVTDTLSKKHRKERLEGEMLGIENDIKILERHDKIFLTSPKQVLF